MKMCFVGKNDGEENWHLIDLKSMKKLCTLEQLDEFKSTVKHSKQKIVTCPECLKIIEVVLENY